MNELSPKERRALRARAHALHPVVIVGGDGITEAVVAEVERNLRAHELIKIRVAEAERDERDAMLEAFCTQTGAAPVQHIGRILVVYRPAPVEAAPERSARADGARRPASPAKSQDAGFRSRRQPQRPGDAPRSPGRPRRPGRAPARRPRTSR